MSVTCTQEKKAVETLILNVKDDNITTIPPENVTVDVVKAGLDVIQNITTVANTTQNDRLQVDILKGAWNFISAVATSDVFVEDGEVKEDLLDVRALSFRAVYEATKCSHYAAV